MTDVTDRLFRRTWQSALIASCFSLAACGGGGDSGSGGLLQTISFDYPGGHTLKSAPVELKATASSGLPVAFRSGSPDICTVSGTQLTLVKVGECLVYANQPGGKSEDGRQWAAADETNQLFTVLKHPQAVTLPDYVLSSVSSSVAISATADSGLPMTYSTSTPEICAFSGTTLQMKKKGSCAVDAVQPGDADYLPLKVQRFIAVDPLLVADGFKPGSGRGTSDSPRTKQDGGVRVNPWNSKLGGWEPCNSSFGDYCYWKASDDGSTLTSSLHMPEEQLTGWYSGANKIDIFVPGLTGVNWSSDTSGLPPVTTEQILAFTLGVNDELYQAGKPILVGRDLGKNNGNRCNIKLRAQLWPSSPGL